MHRVWENTQVWEDTQVLEDTHVQPRTNAYNVEEEKKVDGAELQTPFKKPRKK